MWTCAVPLLLRRVPDLHALVRRRLLLLPSVRRKVMWRPRFGRLIHAPANALVDALIYI